MDTGTFKYFIKVVPTYYQGWTGTSAQHAVWLCIHIFKQVSKLTASEFDCCGMQVAQAVFFQAYCTPKQPCRCFCQPYTSTFEGMLLTAAGKMLHSNQYSLTEYYSPVHKGEVQLPAIYFLYDLSPIMVTVKDARGGLAHLIVRICAVVGGVFAITGKPQ